ncbi:hypothetical protein PRK78_000450 [Emydomyces testavorans]|uniref:Uncharacterized protein n=1 Tax=Emydomyces testavorans TaxID=2070801 RepID=A0AAF0DB41_9EURO|nr:hypothetical protein PRK78_000450 [Emydomyces testavorans]
MITELYHSCAWNHLAFALNAILKYSEVAFNLAAADNFPTPLVLKETGSQLIIARTRVILGLCERLTSVCAEAATRDLQIQVLLEKHQLWPPHCLAEHSLAKIQRLFVEVWDNVDIDQGPNSEYLLGASDAFMGANLPMIDEDLKKQIEILKQDIDDLLKDPFCLLCVIRSECYLYNVEIRGDIMPCSNRHHHFWFHKLRVPGRQTVPHNRVHVDQKVREQDVPKYRGYLTGKDNLFLIHFEKPEARQRFKFLRAALIHDLASTSLKFDLRFMPAG